MSLPLGLDSATILVVDEVGPIRSNRSRILGQAGYRVIEASTGEGAARVRLTATGFGRARCQPAGHRRP